MAAEGTVKVPGIGPVRKKTAATGGIAAVVLVIGIYWYRQRQASSAAAAAPATSTGTAGGAVTDPAGNTCAVLNPQTGYCPGTAEDQQALATLQSGTAYDTSALGTGLNGYYYGPGGSTQPAAPGPGNFADNAEWAQYVEAYLIDTLNADANTVGNAIGKYITGQPIDASQQNVVEEAIAAGGQPPVPGPGGYPPGIRTAHSTGGGNVTVPRVVGQTAGAAHNAIMSAGLIPQADPTQKASDKVTSTAPAGGTSVARGTRVLITASQSGSGGGAGLVTVPNEAGKSAGTAHNDLQRAGLTPVAPPKQRADMRVSHTTPPAGTKVRKGTRVTIATKGFV